MNQITFTKILRTLFWSIALLYLLYIAGSLISFLLLDHNDFVSFFKRTYPQAYGIDEYGERYFTFSHYQFIKQNALLFCLGIITLLVLLIWKRRLTSQFVNNLFEDIRWIKTVIVAAFQDISTNKKVILACCFLLIIILKIYFYTALPFHVDEAFNFTYFVKQGVFHTSIFANNHVLTNIISACWWKLGFSPEFSMRFTSIVSSMMVYVIVYSFTKYYFNFKTALFVLILLVASFWINVYSIEGGAYMLMSLWMILGFLAVCSLSNNPGQGQALFVISSVFGLYTTPLYVIPLAALIIFWISMLVWKSTLRDQLFSISICVSLIVLLSILIYLPMYLWSGTQATFHSSVSRYDLVFMKPALFEGFSVMTGVNTKASYVLVVLLVPSLFYFRRLNKEFQYLIVMLVAIMFSILAFSFIVGVYPPSRALVFSNIIFVVTIGIAIIILIEYSASRYSIAVLSLVLILKMTASVYLHNFGWQRMRGGLQDTTFYEKINGLSNRLLAHKPKIIFADERDTFLNFYLKFNSIKNNETYEMIYERTRMSEADVIIFNDVEENAGVSYEKFYGGEFGIIFKTIE